MQALTPLTIGRNRAAASALGALWGFGHSTGQLILGLALVLLKLAAAGAGGGVTPIRQTVKVGWATYATGIVYGLQPDALFVVVPALALPTKLAAVAYCSMFVIGTVAAMGGYTAVIGTTSAALTKERPWLQDHLSTIASAVAILVGVLVLASGFGLELPFMHAH
ncbi:hypothetical protein MNEG_3094 [Monoraphidium neglectum]|uniref:Nickel/cobalt efflux system n=1 Tax=Monoraphidium neglectum TaxID=145388 RepID=A0A0D2MWM6_9CHLO|nr:hypothetical protein MNEG_3094 [Monoraphidium neglectum]KIZ04862.1 hypothetical protein MNEG_3094 [Monoraphidium neglectum]|eukprot:XP_013903881.1 hypothetical protein MNEG_3094 [Monoraphidium neglectum]